jgi:diguanylate cyclase (GGDEF)-like protein
MDSHKIITAFLQRLRLRPAGSLTSPGTPLHTGNLAEEPPWYVLQQKNEYLEEKNQKLQHQLQKEIQEKKALQQKLQSTVASYKSSLATFNKFKEKIEIVQELKSLNQLKYLLDKIAISMDWESVCLLLDENQFSGYVPEDIPLCSKTELKNLAENIPVQKGKSFFHGPTHEISNLKAFLPFTDKTQLKRLKKGSCGMYILRHGTHAEKILGILSFFADDPNRYSKEKAVDFLNHFCNIFATCLIYIWEHQRLDRASMIDPLTGAYNREYLERFAPSALNFAQRNKFPLSLLFIDLDRFKAINDLYGHRAGDMVLIRVVEEISTILRQYDIFVRLGGDEFVILLPGVDQAASALLYSKIQACINSISLADCINRNCNETISASIGIAHYENGQNLQDLLKQADQQMYTQKNRGTPASPSMD